MTNNKDIYQNNSGLVKKIFEKKESYHKKQIKLPVEEKIKLLVELQKIALTIQPNQDKKNIIWKLK